MDLLLLPVVGILPLHEVEISTLHNKGRSSLKVSGGSVTNIQELLIDLVEYN